MKSVIETCDENLRARYEIPVGTGAGFDLVIDCTHAQKSCIDAWLRNHGFVPFLMALREQTRPLREGEIRAKDCGCGG